MPRLVDDTLLPCHYANYLGGGPACSGGVTHKVERFYKNHRPKEMPEYGVDVVFVCDAHAEWHSRRCFRCAVVPMG